jgi:hypothetical protein
MVAGVIDPVEDPSSSPSVSSSDPIPSGHTVGHSGSQVRDLQRLIRSFKRKERAAIRPAPIFPNEKGECPPGTQQYLKDGAPACRRYGVVRTPNPRVTGQDSLGRVEGTVDARTLMGKLVAPRPGLRGKRVLQGGTYDAMSLKRDAAKSSCSRVYGKKRPEFVFTYGENPVFYIAKEVRGTYPRTVGGNEVLYKPMIAISGIPVVDGKKKPYYTNLRIEARGAYEILEKGMVTMTDDEKSDVSGGHAVLSLNTEYNEPSWEDRRVLLPFIRSPYYDPISKLKYPDQDKTTDAYKEWTKPYRPARGAMSLHYLGGGFAPGINMRVAMNMVTTEGGRGELRVYISGHPMHRSGHASTDVTVWNGCKTLRLATLYKGFVEYPIIERGPMELDITPMTFNVLYSQERLTEGQSYIDLRGSSPGSAATKVVGEYFASRDTKVRVKVGKDTRMRDRFRNPIQAVFDDATDRIVDVFGTDMFLETEFKTFNKKHYATPLRNDPRHKHPVLLHFGVANVGDTKANMYVGTQIQSIPIHGRMVSKGRAPAGCPVLEENALPDVSGAFEARWKMFTDDVCVNTHLTGLHTACKDMLGNDAAKEAFRSLYTAANPNFNEDSKWEGMKVYTFEQQEPTKDMHDWYNAFLVNLKGDESQRKALDRCIRYLKSYLITSLPVAYISNGETEEVTYITRTIPLPIGKETSKKWYRTVGWTNFVTSPHCLKTKEGEPSVLIHTMPVDLMRKLKLDVVRRYNEEHPTQRIAATDINSSRIPKEYRITKERLGWLRVVGNPQVAADKEHKRRLDGLAKQAKRGAPNRYGQVTMVRRMGDPARMTHPTISGLVSYPTSVGQVYRFPGAKSAVRSRTVPPFIRDAIVQKPRASASTLATETPDRRRARKPWALSGLLSVAPGGLAYGSDDEEEEIDAGATEPLAKEYTE